MNYNLILLILANLAFSSCEKDGPGQSTPPATIDNSPKIITVEKDAISVNVMGLESSQRPIFPSLNPIPVKVRGYVKDIAGKPLQGAVIGIRSSYLAGYYSSGQGITDSKGYYEFTPPKGMAEYYLAGYKIAWGSGLAALSLHPADGKMESFVTTDGAVENFVLLPYGITSQEALQTNPHNPSTYYGAAINLSWYSAEDDDDNAPSFAVKEGALLEIVLAPRSKTMDGASGRTITIRKKAGIRGSFRIHNIPLGEYDISVKANGQNLKLKDNSSGIRPYGMTPHETSSTGKIIFWPDQADPSMVAPQVGYWRWVDIRLESQ